MSSVPGLRSELTPTGPTDAAVHETMEARMDRHEQRSRWVHRLLTLAVLLLLIFLGRAIYEAQLLRKNNDALGKKVTEQSLALTQVGTVAPNLGSGLAPPGTVLKSPDGSQTFICGAGPGGTAGAGGAAGAGGTAGAAGAAGEQGVAGTSGSTGASGQTGTSGATGATGNRGATGPQGPRGQQGPPLTATVPRSPCHSRLAAPARRTVLNCSHR